MKPSIKTMMELEKQYADMVNSPSLRGVNLASWLPGLGCHVRSLVPGELMFIMADTGQGKSAALQNIALSLCDPCLFFELELPGSLMFERFAAAAHNLRCSEIEESVKAGKYLSPNDYNHIYVCDDTRLTPDQMRDLILREFAEKSGCAPSVVFVDYIGLMAAGGRSRYERTSQAAEDLKVLAKQCNVVVIAATQVGRPEDKDIATDLTLHSAKDSGSIESSCGVLLGMWRDQDDAATCYIKVLKNTKGKSGGVITCNFDGARMRITERARTNDGEYEDLSGEVDR